MNANGHRTDSETATPEHKRRVASPPDDLDDASKRFWRRTRRQLKAQGTWDDAYVAALERYVRACELARHARELVPDHGTTTGSRGQWVEHPLIKTSREAERDAHRYAEALLLLPADRHKLGLGEEIGDGLPSWLTDA